MKLTLDEIEKKVDRGEQSLDMSGTILSERYRTMTDIKLICDYLKDNPNITSLSLRYNRIGAEGAKALAGITTLTSLDLHGNDILDEGVKAFAANSTLTTLDVSVNNICHGGAIVLAMNNTLTTLNINANKIGDQGIKAFAANRTLTNLSVQSNNIGSKYTKLLAANINLRVLDVSLNKIGDEGIKALALSPSLTSLDMSWNRISDEGSLTFVSALKNNFTLVNLSHDIMKFSMIEMIKKILARNRALPWQMTINYARLMAQAQRSENCLLGILPVEVLGLINDYAVSANHFSFFISQFDKRPTADDLNAAKQMVSREFIHDEDTYVF